MKPTQIQQRREAIGLSRESLAGRAQIALRTLERIERGEVEPRRATLVMIEQALEAEQAEAAA